MSDNKPSRNQNTPLSYRDAGVDIAAGNELVKKIRSSVSSTHRPGVMGNIGGFGGLFELPVDRYKNPVLVSGTDGVGTKLKLAIELNKHSTIGIDLVAMCVNDILVLGAEPLFFLDYYATGKLNTSVAASVVEGIAEGCRQSGAALIGGETAEMPGMYNTDDYDLAGFCVGVVEKQSIIDGSKVQSGDALIALASSGPHSNGYSLIRKVIELNDTALNSGYDESNPKQSLGDALLAPTRIYVSSVHQVMQKISIHAMAHITGGGLLENIPRVLPEKTKAALDAQNWQLSPIFQWLKNNGNIDDMEMYRTFNCGIGMVIIVANNDAEKTIDAFNDAGETAWLLGKIESSTGQPKVVFK